MRILLCEDEIEQSNALVKILRHNNFSVDAVYDGEEAFDYIETLNYDAVIMDVMMPKLDGFSLLKKIRNMGILVPVIMLTAKSEIDDKVLGLDIGANDYLTKPFSAKELMARLRAITRLSTDTNSSLLSAGDIFLDRKTFELYTKQNSIILTGKEFQIMEMLMVNSSQVISTDRFMDKIWGYASETEKNVVWVNISCLRKKLISIGSKQKIKAIRNRGYMLEDK